MSGNGADRKPEAYLPEAGFEPLYACPNEECLEEGNVLLIATESHPLCDSCGAVMEPQEGHWDFGALHDRPDSGGVERHN